MGEAPQESTPTIPARPPCPDRLVFQTSLADVNASIEAIKNELKQLRDSIRDLKSKVIEGRRRRAALKRDFEMFSPQIEDLRVKIAHKTRELGEMDTDILHKNEDLLAKRIKDLERQYQNMKTRNPREETAVVKEIEALHKNQAKLKKYLAVKKEQSLMEQEQRELRARREVTRRDDRRVRADVDAVQGELFKLHRHLQKLNMDHRANFDERVALLQRYDEERCRYSEWTSKYKKKGAHSVYPATFPTSNHRHRRPQKRGEESDEMDEEELELFHEQKTSCQRLLNYLEALLAQMDPEPSVHQSGSQRKDSCDSADELPDEVQKLRQRCNPDLVPRLVDDAVLPLMQSVHLVREEVPKPRKRSSKRIPKKGHQAITHPIELMNMFKEIEVDCPSLYQDVAMALEAVRNKMHFYQNQTSIEPWTDDMYGADGMRSTVSESGLTADSGAWAGSTDMSESASLNSFSFAASPPADASDNSRPASAVYASSMDVHSPISNGQSTRGVASSSGSAVDSYEVISRLEDVVIARQSDEGDSSTKTSQQRDTGIAVMGSKESSSNSAIDGLPSEVEEAIRSIKHR